MHLVDRPYETAPDPLRSDQRAELHFDATLLAATASPEALKPRGVDLSQGPRADDATVWDGSTTPAAFCKLLRDWEAAYSVRYEHAPDDATDVERDRAMVLGPVARLLFPTGTDPSGFAQARAAYLRGDWSACEAQLAEVVEQAPDSARAHLLCAHARLRLGRDAEADESLAAALRLGREERDLTLHASYLAAYVATRRDAPRKAVLIGNALLGALGGGRGTVTWSMACDDLALDLAYLALRACAQLVAAGEPTLGPPAYDRARALIVRHPLVALRLAADPVMAPLREDIANAIQTQREALQREIRLSLERWRREIARQALAPDDDEAVRFIEESRLADTRASRSLLDAMDARLRLRDALPDVLASTQRSFSSEADDAERSSSAMIPLTQPYDPHRRDNRLRSDVERMRSALDAPTETPAPDARRSPGRAPSLVAGAVAWAGAAACWFAPGVPDGWRDPLVVALCIGGALGLSRLGDRRA